MVFNACPSIPAFPSRVFLRFHFRRIRKSRFQKFGAFPKRFLRIGNANHVSLNSAVFARGDFGNVICVSEAFPETFGKTPLETQKAHRKRDSRFRPHFGGKFERHPWTRNFRFHTQTSFPNLSPRCSGNAQSVSETPRAFPQFVGGRKFAQVAFPMRDAFSLGLVKKLGGGGTRRAVAPKHPKSALTTSSYPQHCQTTHHDAP